MSFSAKLTLLICVMASFLSNCSLGENVAPHRPVEFTFGLGGPTDLNLSFGRFQSISKYAPLPAETLYEMALKTRIVDSAAAEDLVKEAVRLKPDFAEAIYALGWIGRPVITCGMGGHSKKELHEIVKYSQKAISLKPTLFSAQADLIRALIGLKRYQEAEAAFDQMRFFQAETIDDQIDFAKAHWALGRIKEAIWCFEKAIGLIDMQLHRPLNDATRAELCSTQIGVYHILSGLYFEIGDYKKADEYFRIRDH